MAKTIFTNGTYILADWLNSIFGGGAKSAWVANQAYAAGVVIKLSGGEILRCIVAGTSHAATEPTAPGTLRGTVVDNTVTWELFAGHLHDGKAMDGSAPKVLLTAGAEVEGALPQANVYDLGLWHAVSVTCYKCVDILGGTPTSLTPDTLEIKGVIVGKHTTLRCHLVLTAGFAAGDFSVKITLPTAFKHITTSGAPKYPCLWQVSSAFHAGLVKWGADDYLLIHKLDGLTLETLTVLDFTIVYEAP